MTNVNILFEGVVGLDEVATSALVLNFPEPLDKHYFRNSDSCGLKMGSPTKAWGSCWLIDPSFLTFFYTYSTFTVLRNMAE